MGASLNSQSEQEKIKGTKRWYRIEADVRILALDEQEAERHATAFLLWLEEQRERGLRAVRFLEDDPKQLTAAVEDPPLPSTPGNDDADADRRENQCKAYLVRIALPVIADDEDLAQRRFGSFKSWLTLVRDSGHSATRSLDFQVLSDPTTVVHEGERVIEMSEYELRLSNGLSWFDSADDGEVGQREVDEVVLWDLDDQRWLRTDELIEAVESLEMAAGAIARAGDDPYQWKWALFGLHNSLQAFMVLAVRGTSNIAVTSGKDLCEGPRTFRDCARCALRRQTRKLGQRSLQKINKRFPSFEPIGARILTQLFRLKGTSEFDREPEFRGYLIKFMELYKRIKDERWMRQYTNSKAFRPSGSQGGSVRRLNDFRNDFVHFVPLTWRLELQLLPQIALDVNDIIGFLAFESQNVPWFYQGGEELEARTRSAHERVKTDATLLKKRYGTVSQKHRQLKKKMAGASASE